MNETPMKTRRLLDHRLTAVALGVMLTTGSALAAGNAAAPTTQLRINLREAPNLNSRITAVVPMGGTVEVLEEVGEFVRVRRPSGSVGYLKHKYLNGYEVTQRAAIPPEETPSAPAMPPPSAPLPPPAMSAAPEPAAAPDPSSDRPAVKADVHGKTSDFSRWHLQAAAGLFTSFRSTADITRDLATDGQAVTFNNLETETPYAALRARYRLSPAWGVELGYLHLQPLDFDLRSAAPAANAEALAASLEQHLPPTGPGATLALTAERALGAWRLEARAGVWHSFENDLSFALDATQTVIQDDSKTAALLGLGAHYAIWERFELGVELMAIQADDPIAGLGLVLGYRP